MNRVLTYQIWHRRDLRPVDKLTLLALAQLCRQDGDTCHASIRYLAVMLNTDAGSVHRAIRRLADAGLITRFQAHRRAPTEYTLHPTR